MDGLTQTVARNIIFNRTGQDLVRFSSVSKGGFAPFRGKFDLLTKLPAGQSSAVRFEIDFDGDGAFEIDSPNSPAFLSYEYQSAGVYLARARVTFDDAQTPTPVVVIESTFRIHADTIAFFRETLCSVYYEMKHRLQAGQITSAGDALRNVLECQCGIGARYGWKTWRNHGRPSIRYLCAVSGRNSADTGQPKPSPRISFAVCQIAGWRLAHLRHVI